MSDLDLKPILVIGYGNPGRLDDGLGPAFIELLQDKDSLNIDCHACYQLSVEEAYDLREREAVVFVDACMNIAESFSFYEIKPIENAPFGSHSLSPEAVLSLCNTLYDDAPEAYILAIRGQDFDGFGERLSDQAESNLNEALRFFYGWLKEQKTNKCQANREQSNARTIAC